MPLTPHVRRSFVLPVGSTFVDAAAVMEQPQRAEEEEEGRGAKRNDDDDNNSNNTALHHVTSSGGRVFVLLRSAMASGSSCDGRVLMLHVGSTPDGDEVSEITLVCVCACAPSSMLQQNTHDPAAKKRTMPPTTTTCRLVTTSAVAGHTLQSIHLVTLPSPAWKQTRKPPVVSAMTSVRVTAAMST